MKKLLPFSYYGGKYSHLDWLLPLIPKTQIFVDCFGGSASVILNREPSPIMVFNDLNCDVVNFFEVLRDNPDELIRQLNLTLYSREEHNRCRLDEPGISRIEQARRFFVRIYQNFNSSLEGGWAVNKKDNMSRLKSWLSAINRLPELAAKLKSIQIECLPALELIKRYDSPDTFFYCDPPYLHNTRISIKDYGDYEMTDQAHVDLGCKLLQVQGQAAISGYKHHIYSVLFEKWKVHKAPLQAAPGSLKKEKRQEILWTNYNL